MMLSMECMTSLKGLFSKTSALSFVQMGMLLPMECVKDANPLVKLAEMRLLDA